MEKIGIENNDTDLQWQMEKILRRFRESGFNPYFGQPSVERVVWFLLRSKKQSWEEKLDEAIKKEFLDTTEMRTSQSPKVKGELAKLDEFKARLLAILREIDK